MIISESRMAWFLRGFTLAAAVFFSVLALPAHAVTLKIATLSPEGSGWMKVLRQHAAAIEAQTGGEVKFKIYPGGVMGDDKAVLRKMRVGQLHGAVLTSGGLAQVYPDITLYNLPMMFHNDAEVDHVRKSMDAKLMQGLAAEEYVGFGFAEVGFAYPMMQMPGTSVADMRDRKVWAPDNDPASLQAYQAFGISPIPLPIADVLAGLQTGLIDSIGSPPIGAIALQWHTQVQHALELPLIYVYGLFALTEKGFNRIDAEFRDVVRSELEKAVRIVDASARKDHLSAKSALVKQGIDWVRPSSSERDEWLNLAAKSRQTSVAEGHISPTLYAEVERLLAEARGG